MRSEHAFPFGTYRLFDHYLIGSAHYGVHFGPEEIREVLSWANGHFTEPFGYISVRVQDHSRDLTVYRDMHALSPLLVSLAIVHPVGDRYRFGELERQFARQYLKVEQFDTTEEAVTWTLGQVASLRSKTR